MNDLLPHLALIRARAESGAIDKQIAREISSHHDTIWRFRKRHGIIAGRKVLGSRRRKKKGMGNGRI